MAKIQKSDKEWREQLSEEQYRVLRQKGTEIPFSGEFAFSKDKGTYQCVACGADLFESENKHDSITPGLQGWPSFSDAIDGAVELKQDDRYGMIRTEVVCSNCGSHLGHLFDDENTPGGQHFCINSVCLGFNPKDNPQEEKA